MQCAIMGHWVLPPILQAAPAASCSLPWRQRPPNWRAWARSGAQGITALAALESMDRRLSQWNLVEEPGRRANPRQALRSRAFCKLVIAPRLPRQYSFLGRKGINPVHINPLALSRSARHGVRVCSSIVGVPYSLPRMLRTAHQACPGGARSHSSGPRACRSCAANHGGRGSGRSRAPGCSCTNRLASVTGDSAYYCGRVWMRRLAPITTLSARQGIYVRTFQRALWAGAVSQAVGG